MSHLSPCPTEKPKPHLQLPFPLLRQEKLVGWVAARLTGSFDIPHASCERRPQLEVQRHRLQLRKRSELRALDYGVNGQDLGEERRQHGKSAFSTP